MMHFPRLKGLLLLAWVLAVTVWTGFYFSRPARLTGIFDSDFTSVPSVVFNWLFPIGLVYLMLTVGDRNR